MTEKEKVPQSVVATFLNKYPDEDDANWVKDDSGLWEAQFDRNGEDYRAGFKENGLWVETELTLAQNDIPKSVNDAVTRDFKNQKIKEVELVNHFSKGVFYKVEFMNDNSTEQVNYKRRRHEALIQRFKTKKNHAISVVFFM